MVAGNVDHDRHVVPRWRSVGRTLEAGEFQALQDARSLDEAQVEELDEAEWRWRTARTEIAAAELAGAALVAGEAHRAESTVEVLRGSESDLLRKLADRVEKRWLNLGPNQGAFLEGQESSVVDGTVAVLYDRVGKAKARLVRDPRNAIAWGDLARGYIVLGERERARRALQVARSLAPSSRYLLRAATRLSHQLGQPGAAVKVLESSERTREDPWLQSALLSSRAIAGVPQRGVKAARRLLKAGNHRQIELAELTSEIGTLELEAGSDRRARQLFLESLIAPTDNSLAQAEWASHRMNLAVPLETLHVPFAAEAHARSLTQEGDWQAALDYSRKWFDDQPFDADAAVFGSYIASAGLDDWEGAREIADAGLRANPTERMLRNNLAYAQIELGNLDDAAEILRRVATDSDELETVAVVATEGLLAYRLGDTERGQLLYERAARMARRLGSSAAEATARAMWLREAVRCGESDLAARVKVIEDLRGSTKDPGAARCVDRALSMARNP